MYNLTQIGMNAEQEGGDSLKKKVNMNEAGQKMRELRGIRTRSGVARHLGLAYTTLQSYEDGKREPPDSVKKQLADYYGVPMSEIFG